MPQHSHPAAPSPFDLEDQECYARWRAARLTAAPQHGLIEIRDIARLSAGEHRQILDACALRNYALFRVSNRPQDTAHALQDFAEALGLERLDRNLCADENGLTPITVRATGTDNTYIPYTNRPLGWHTDGYYNAGQAQVRAWLLYCVQPADEGGDNELLDHEIAYIRVRDQNPEWIRALMAPDAFTIPGNTEAGVEIRPDHSGPVFSIDPADGHLHMRYSARQRNVIWKDDGPTRAAADFLLRMFEHGDSHIVRHRLQAGEGIISNNVLHRRDGFRDDPAGARRRLLYRARYHRRLPEPREL